MSNKQNEYKFTIDEISELLANKICDIRLDIENYKSHVLKNKEDVKKFIINLTTMSNKQNDNFLEAVFDSVDFKLFLQHEFEMDWTSVEHDDPDVFDEWFCSLDPQELIDFANDYCKKQLEKLFKQL